MQSNRRISLTVLVSNVLGEREKCRMSARAAFTHPGRAGRLGTHARGQNQLRAVEKRTKPACSTEVPLWASPPFEPCLISKRFLRLSGRNRKLAQ